MDDTFEIPVIYKGEELFFKARLQIMGYTYKIEVDVFGQPVLLETDEERNYRAVIGQEKMEAGKRVDVELLKEIVAALETIVK